MDETTNSTGTGTPAPVTAAKQRRGFLAMSRRTARAIHAAGGRETARRYGSDYMRALGAKGGSRPKPKRVTADAYGER